MEKSPVDLFLELIDENKKKVEGETRDQEFSKKKAIEISEFKLDGDSAESRAKKGKKKKRDKGGRDSDDDDEGGGESKGPYCKFEITKTVDASSPNLLLAYCWTISSGEAADGPKYTTARISVRKGGAGQLVYLVLEFTEVSVISYSLDIKSETPEETMVFKFEEIEMTYHSQADDGTLDTRYYAGWNFHDTEELKSR